MPSKNVLDDDALFLALKLNSNSYSSRNSALHRRSSVESFPPCLKLKAGIFLTTTNLSAVYLVLLSGDVSLNPGPSVYVSDSSDVSGFDSDSEDTSCDMSGTHYSYSTCSDTECSSDDGDNYCDPYPYFDLGLGDKCLRFGHWNVNTLTSTKFDQIKLFLLGKTGQQQIDVFFMSETKLKPKSPDSLYAVPGFSIHCQDRKGDKGGAGVMAFVNDELRCVRRTDLEDSNLEIIWLEIFPFKSKRPLLIAGIYRPPSSLKEKDQGLERNIESAYLLNKETILLGDFNIDFLNKQTFDKHRLLKGLTTMHFNQLVDQVTRSSGTCLDHIYSNYPKRITGTTVRDFGLSDHLPTFDVRCYKRKDLTRPRKGAKTMTYRDMKRFDEEQFKSSIENTPWDSVFVFDDIDDILETWEKLFNDAVDTHCPWHEKRVKQPNQAPWMTKGILEQLRLRDTLLKSARKSKNPNDWER